MIHNKLIKYIALFLILTLSAVSLSGCYNINNIDKLAYVIALGIDVGESNVLKLSFQFSTLGTSSSGGSGESNSDNPIINTIECSSIESGISIINSYLSKEINLAHCKVVVFSEEIACKGIEEYLYTLMNNSQIRPDTNIIVSKCDVKFFLDNSKPVLESIAAKYYETAPTSSEYTGFTQNVTLNDFFSALSNTYTNPVAILGGVNTPNTHETQDSLDNFEKDSSYKAGETMIDSKPNVETMGLAVFYGDALVGELNAIETLCHMIIINQLERCRITIPSPFKNGETVSLSLKRKNNTKKKVELVNGSPYITVSPSFEARVLSVNSNSEPLTEDKIKLVEKYAISYLESQISSYLYKTSKEYRADIDGFGKYALKSFLFWKDWESFNWNSNYRNAFFKVNVNIDVISGQLLMQV